MFQDYLQKKLKYLSGNAGKYTGAYFILYSIYNIHNYIIQWEQISTNSQIYLLSLEENWIIIWKNRKMDTFLVVQFFLWRKIS